MKYPNAEFVWVQEEHANSGAWGFIEPRFNMIMENHGKDEIGLVSRPTSAATATGYPSIHE